MPWQRTAGSSANTPTNKTPLPTADTDTQQHHTMADSASPIGIANVRLLHTFEAFIVCTDISRSCPTSGMPQQSDAHPLNNPLT